MLKLQNDIPPFNLNHQQKAGILRKWCKKNHVSHNSPGTNIEHKFFVKTLELLRKRNHDLLINTHCKEQTTGQILGLFKATLHTHMNAVQIRLRPSIYLQNIFSEEKHLLSLHLHLFLYVPKHYKQVKVFLSCYIGNVTSYLKMLWCKVKHSKSRHSSNQVTCATLIFHIRYIHYNTSIKYIIIDYFSMWICIFHLVHMILQEQIVAV